MIYRRIETVSDTDIPYLTEILNLPEISHFISINENNYWNYVTETENVFYFKVFNNDILVAATHCEISNKTLYMDIMIIPKYQRNGIATRILQDIKSGKLDIDYKKIPNLASEAREKLERVRPLTISQAQRISGVNPSDISILLVYLESGRRHDK